MVDLGGAALPGGTATTLADGDDTTRVLDLIADAVLAVDETGLVVLANPAAARLLDRPVTQLVGLPLGELVPPRFRAAHREGFTRFLTTGERQLDHTTAVQVAALRADGTEVPIELTLGTTGRPGEPGFLVVGTLRDVSTRLRLERQALLTSALQATVDAAQDGVLAWSYEGRVLAVNRHFARLWDLEPEDVAVGSDVATVLTRQLRAVTDPAPLLEAVGWARRHPTRSQPLELRRHDGRVVQGYGAPITDEDGQALGRVWYLHDDTERRQAEAQRAALLERLADAERSQRFLLRASEVLAHASGFAETLQALAAVAVPRLGDICLIDVLDHGGRVRRLAAVHADPARQHLVDELRQRYAPLPDGGHPSLEAMRERRSYSSPEMTEEFLRATTVDDRHLALVQELGFTSYMTVPLVGADEVLGSLTLVSAGSGRRLGPEDVALAEQLANRVALVVAKERRYDAERAISHTLQTSLLHNVLPDVPGIDVVVRYVPGTADAEVGGDFWDVSLMPSGEVAIALGDVAGHDIQAAATMAQLRSACRALRSQTHGPDALVRLLHQSWDQLGLDRIATAAFARVVPETGRLRIASAGHLPPLIVEPDRAWFPAVEPAAPLGAPTNEEPPLWVGELPAGATIVFYTDGLVEDRHRDIDEGTGRLIRAAMAGPRHDPEALVDHILQTLSGDDRADDVAVLAVHRRLDA